MPTAAVRARVALHALLPTTMCAGLSRNVHSESAAPELIVRLPVESTILY